MTSTTESPGHGQMRTYNRADSVVFLKTNEPFGGLSNMAGGFPLRVNGIRILTSEALYQACRFPYLPQVQRLIIGQTSPMTAKMKSKPYRRDSRPDWDQVRVKVMRWCLWVKLAQNWEAFSKLLLETGDRSIVEQSRRDDYWGARPVDEHSLIGMNVLGRLLMELREAVKAEGREPFLRVEPPGIRDFLLDGRPIEAVNAPDCEVLAGITRLAGHPSYVDTGKPNAVRPSFFDPPAVKEASSSEDANESSKSAGFAELKPYPAYKDSGVPWLGEVPENWEVLPNRALFSEVKEREHSDEEMLSVTITNGVIRQRSLLADTSKKDSSREDRSAYKLVQPGDIAYNKMRTWQGAIGVSQYRGIVSPAYVVQRPRDGAESRYFHYLFRTPAFAKEAERWSYGITSDMWSLRPEHFKMIYVCLPPLTEQAAIARFLAYIDRQIRRYIRAKHKLIKLLEEQKQSIIHRAVTRGLDPNARLKPSGVEWLGDVPDHWEVLPLRRITVSRCDGPVGSGLKSLHYTDQGIRVVRLQNIGHAEFKDADAAFISPSHYATLGDHTVEPGDLLIAGLGDERHPAGRACVAPSSIVPAMVKADCFRFRLFRQRLDPEFAALHLTSTAVDASSFLSTGATRQRINLQAMASHSVAVPPTQEQLAIVQHITNETSSLRLAISNAYHEIDLIREYHTRLIADVVTGKLDVRGVELPKADETAVLGDIDDIEDMAAVAEETDEVEATEEGSG